MNLLQSRIYVKEELKFEKLKDSDEIIIYDDETTQNRYLIHKKRNILLIDTLWIKIMKDYNVPVYNHGKVHFKDVCKKLIKNASDEQKLDDVLKRKLRKKWDLKYKSANKFNKIDILDKVIATKIIFKWIKFRRLRAHKRSESELKMKEDSKKHLIIFVKSLEFDFLK